MTTPAPAAGARFGAAASGVGSVATMGRRVGAFLIDVTASALVALAFTWPAAPQNLSVVVWAAMTIVGQAAFGMTVGQYLVGIRVASIYGKPFLGAWATVRAALIFIVIPVVIVDSDGRGLHDKACRTIVLRFR